MTVVTALMLMIMGFAVVSNIITIRKVASGLQRTGTILALICNVAMIAGILFLASV